MKQGCFSQCFFEFSFELFRGKSDRLALALTILGVIILYEAVLGLLKAS